MAKETELLLLLIALGGVFVWSLINPHDGVTWLMEAMPVIIAVTLLAATRRTFPLTRLSYYLIFFHAVVLLVGAHYTYSRVPLGNWVAELLGVERNHYDRFAHVVQGFVPAIIAREILIRGNVIVSARWLFFIVCCVCLAISALYEIIEWQAALIGGDGTLAFLGVQGDVWDAQWDMTFALLGAIAAQCALAGVHQRQLGELTKARGAGDDSVFS